MRRNWVAPLLFLSFVLPLAAGQAEWLEAKTEDMEVKARLVRERPEMAQLLGDDLDGEFILIEMDIKPMPGAKLELKRDQFMMRTYRNNDTSYAQSPDRIAGSGELVLGKGETTTVGIYSQTGYGIPVGGAPGTGTRPRRIGNEEPVHGGGVSSKESTQVSSRHGSEGDLLGKLRELELPLGEIDDVAHGYLYFQLSPKEKPKNLTLNYDGPSGEWQIQFKQ